MEIGTLKSFNPNYKDIILTESKLIFGRGPKSDIILMDLRCSGLHCTLTPLKSENWEFLIEDFSSNGTYINKSLIGKNCKKIAKFNDVLDLLIESPRVQRDSMISFQFIQNLKRKCPEKTPEKSLRTSEDLEDEISCKICMEIFRNPLCLYPCLHNFCEVCYLDWSEKSKECPTCRVFVTNTGKSEMVEKLIHIYLQKYPEKRIFTEKCRQCDEEIDDFQCAPNQKHVKCKKCLTLIPERKNHPQKCEACNDYFCNLYFFDCKTGLEYLENYCKKANMIPTGFHDNIVEENILLDYTRINKLTGQDIINLVVQQGQSRFNLKSIICSNCFNKVWEDIIEKFRDIIQGKLPDVIRQKEFCSKGINCKLQYSILHSQKFNHV